MKLGKTHFIVFCVGIFLGLCTGFFTGKAIYDKPLNVGIKRDTVVVHDTIVDVAPVPKDSVRTRYVTRYLPLVKRDTVDHFLEVTKMVRDTVEVEIPITSKHFSGKNYDAYVSGFETNLDSIFVYNETQLITETITRMKPPNKFSLDIRTGADYFTGPKDLWPYATANAEYNISNSRFSIGARGGVYYDTHEVKPFGGGYFKFRLM